MGGVDGVVGWVEKGNTAHGRARCRKPARQGQEAAESGVLVEHGQSTLSGSQELVLLEMQLARNLGWMGSRGFSDVLLILAQPRTHLAPPDLIRATSPKQTPSYIPHIP